MKIKHSLLLLGCFLCFSFQREPDTNTFDEQIARFLKSFSPHFQESAERYTNSKSNDYVLEQKTADAWHQTITLKSSKSFKNHYDQTVYQRLYLGFHHYESIAACDTAFAQLMNCLGTDCFATSWGNEETRFKTTPFIYLKTNREIIFGKIHCEQENEFWPTFKKQLIQEFSIGTTKVVEAACGGPLTFTKLL